MKKLVTLFLAACLLLTSVAGASAIEFRPSGAIIMSFFSSNTILGSAGPYQDRDTVEHNSGGDNPDYEPVRYQFRMQYALSLGFVASEQLAGRIGFAGNDRGFAQTRDGETGWGAPFYVSTAYIDWYIPNTSVEVRLGRWRQDIYDFTGTLDLLSFSGPQSGVRVLAEINDNVNLLGFWWRLADEREDGVGSYNSGYVDQFFVEAPLVFDGFLVNAWFTYIRNQHSSTFGPVSSVPFLTARYATWDGNSFAPVSGNIWENTRLWAFGGGFSLSKFSPFVIEADFGYSDIKVNGVQFNTANDTIGVNAPNAFDRNGWYLSGRVKYHTVYGTPSLFAWCTSGDDDNLSNGSERPFAIDNDNSGVHSMFGIYRDSSQDLGQDTGFDMAGTWGFSAQLEDLSFVEDLSHQLALTYIRGTNDPAMAKYRPPLRAIPSPYEYMTSKDSAIALEMATTYEIYEELSLVLDMFYVWENFDSKTWSAFAGPVFNIERPRLGYNQDGSFREPEFVNTWGIGLSIYYLF